MIRPLNRRQRLLKRGFDVVLASLGLVAFGWLILLAWLAATIDTGAEGLFRQTRIGYGGRPFRVLKIRTMRPCRSGTGTTVTVRGDARITRLGAALRRAKIDELPQLINILRGEMSFVGPRPDVPGFADCLEGDDRLLLSLRPGITGPATLRYRHEEELLAAQPDPEQYNRLVIWPDKVRLNLHYLRDWSLLGDLRWILRTVLGTEESSP